MKTVQWKVILKVVGLVLIFESLFMAMSSLFSVYYHDNDAIAIIKSSLITLGSGLLLHFGIKNANYNSLGKREGYIIVSISWFILAAFGSLPYIISGYIPNFIDAYFETVSGFTTTGSTILTDIEKLPHGLLIWRSLTQWLGGLGVIVLVIAILPFFGFGGMQLYSAEITGPNKEKLRPRISSTARHIWGIYILLSIILCILYIIGDMSLFDSLCHTFSTMSSGGFSTKNASLANYSSYIQWITTLFMFFSGINLALFYSFFNGNIRSILKNEELKFYTLFFIVSSISITVVIYNSNLYDFGDSLRHASFQAISIISTTGYASANYMQWPTFTYSLLFILFFSGAMAGSTSGSIKIIRHVILGKAVANSIKKTLHPNAVIPVSYNGSNVHQKTILNVISVAILFIVIFLGSSALLSCIGEDITVSLSASASAICNIGPGLGDIGPAGNFSQLHDMSKCILSFVMILGRLEIVSVLILLFPAFWKK